MAQRLLGAGHDLRVYNRTRSSATTLEHAGARSRETPREASDGADAVIAMTADDASSRPVWLGPDGILAARLTPQAFAIECSTLSYDWVMELASKAHSRDLRYIDAPVTGLPDALRLKDVEYALKFARTLGIGSPFGQLAARQLRRLIDLGHMRANESKIMEVARSEPPAA
jgi:3-hydroxyisobutyrate dehydrogenase-like beta-hydroxyacid dehydrogenase